MATKKTIPSEVQGEATFTILTTNQGVLTKEFSLDALGVLRKRSAPNFSGGTYEIAAVHSLRGFLQVRSALTSAQALMYSTPINGTRCGRITTQERRSKGVLSRTKDCFQHPSGPAVMAIDYDPRPGLPALTQKQLISVLQGVIPGLQETELLWATSAGSCISDRRTGLEHAGVTGQRVYVMVADGRDIKRALQTLAQRLWLADHAWIKVSRSGRKLKRTLVDLALANPVQPDFAAGAACTLPLEQRSQQKRIGQGGPLNSVTAIPSLTPAEETRLTEIYATAEAAAEPEAQTMRERWLVAYGERAVHHAASINISLSEEDKRSIHEVAVEALNKRVLGGSFLIKLADGSEVSVGDILKDPARYHEVLCYDPLEPGYDDDRVVGKIFTTKTPCIHSYAHGGQTFTLLRQQTDVEWLNADSAISVQATLATLRSAGSFYDYGNTLVHVEEADVHVLTPATAVHYLGSQCRFWQLKLRRDGEPVRVNCDPPEKLVKQMVDLGARRDLRKLLATSDVPIILPDGKVVASSGYDASTGILVVTSTGLTIPETPTKDQVRDALAILWQPVSLFPYVDAGARSNCLAALLTAVVRRVIPTALGIAVDAPQRGTGKTKLLRTIMALHCGRNPDLSPLPSGGGRDEELRKKITSTLLDGRDHVLFDNIVGNFDSLVLAALMTTGHWADRILGKSLEYKGHARLLVGVNGNNLSLVGDLARRFLQIRLDAGTENPFGRHFDFDPEDRVLEQREHLVVAAITAIRAWFAAGSPGAHTAGIGGFEGWGLVRGPLLWFAAEGLLPFEGFVDPLDTLTDAVGSDPEQEDLVLLLSALRRILADQEVTANELLSMLRVNTWGDKDKAVVHEFLANNCRNGVTPISVGRVLNFRRDRAAGGLKLGFRQNRDKVHVYRVVPVAEA